MKMRFWQNSSSTFEINSLFWEYLRHSLYNTCVIYKNRKYYIHIRSIWEMPKTCNEIVYVFYKYYIYVVHVRSIPSCIPHSRTKRLRTNCMDGCHILCMKNATNPKVSLWDTVLLKISFVNKNNFEFHLADLICVW